MHCEGSSQASFKCSISSTCIASSTHFDLVTVNYCTLAASLLAALYVTANQATDLRVASTDVAADYVAINFVASNLQNVEMIVVTVNCMAMNFVAMFSATVDLALVVMILVAANYAIVNFAAVNCVAINFAIRFEAINFIASKTNDAADAISNQHKNKVNYSLIIGRNTRFNKNKFMELTDRINLKSFKTFVSTFTYNCNALFPLVYDYIPSASGDLKNNS